MMRQRLTKAIDRRVALAVSRESVSLRANVQSLLDEADLRRSASEAAADARAAVRSQTLGQAHEDLSQRLLGQLSGLHNALGSISASVADSQRQQAVLLDRLAVRLDSVEAAGSIQIMESIASAPTAS